MKIRNTPALRAVLEVALLRHPAEFSGSDVIFRAGVLSGTLYPLLDRLEHAGWLKSTWENVDPRELGRPRRRLYRLTGAGVRAAKDRLIDRGKAPSLKPASGKLARGRA